MLKCWHQPDWTLCVFPACISVHSSPTQQRNLFFVTLIWYYISSFERILQMIWIWSNFAALENVIFWWFNPTDLTCLCHLIRKSEWIILHTRSRFETCGRLKHSLMQKQLQGVIFSLTRFALVLEAMKSGQVGSRVAQGLMRGAKPQTGRSGRSFLEQVDLKHPCLLTSDRISLCKWINDLWQH